MICFQKRFTVVLCLASLFFYALSISAASAQSESFLKYEVNDVLVGILTHTIRLYNPSSQKTASGDLYVPLLRNDTARVYVVLSNVSSPMAQPTLVSDDSANTYAHWNGVAINAKQTLTFEVNYHLLSFGTQYLVNSSLVGDYDINSDLYKKFMQPEELVQSEDPRIIQVAQNLTANGDSLHDKVLKIYDFVVTHLRYQVQDEERGALWALDNGVGDCSEYSYLFVALCRAAGIPARIQAGFAFHNVGESLEDGHMWAEYYLENYGWIPVDATWQQFDALDDKHFSSQQSTPELTPYANYVFNSANGLEVTDEQTVQLKSASISVFGEDSAIENLKNTAQTIKEAEYALFLGRIFKASLIFPSEMEEAQRTLLESQIQLQNAIESWKGQSQIALLDTAKALEGARNASQSAWLLIAETFALFIGVSTFAMLAILVYLKRFRVKREVKV